MTKKFNVSKIMIRAWEMKKTAEKESGMKAEFSICLKMAWAEAKESFELPALKGTPKQIAWAKDIRDTFIARQQNLEKNICIEAMWCMVEHIDKHRDDVNFFKKAFKAGKKEVLSHEEATYYIDIRSNLTGEPIDVTLRKITDYRVNEMFAEKLEKQLEKAKKCGRFVKEIEVNGEKYCAIREDGCKIVSVYTARVKENDVKGRLTKAYDDERASVLKALEELF